jgi:hypothetical protein
MKDDDVDVAFVVEVASLKMALYEQGDGDGTRVELIQ